MNNETPQIISDDRPVTTGIEGNEGTAARRIELDWTESEWFQVWLDLARHPYSRQTTDRELVLHVIPIGLGKEASRCF